MQFLSNSPIETQKFATDIAQKISRGAIMALSGELGAGKTCFVQGLAEGLGVSKKYYVNSPTFTILNIYEGGKMPIYHFDWYRLASEAEAIDIGLEEYFDGKGVCVIEWAEKFPKLLPERAIWVKMDVAGEGKRKIICSADL